MKPGVFLDTSEDVSLPLTFHRIRLMTPNNRIPATAATMMIHMGTSYGVSSPRTGSMFRPN